MEMKSPAFLKIYGEAMFVFGSAKLVANWLSTPVEAFGDRAPQDLVETESGRTKIRARLRELELDYKT